MAYCAATDILDWGKFTTTDATPILNTIIPRAEAIIDQYCGRTFECTSAEVSTRYLDVYSVLDDGVTLMFDKDFCGVGTDASPITVGSDAIVASNFVYIPTNETPYYGIRLKDNSTNSWDLETSDGDWENAISIKGYWAYSKTAPADIAHACVRLTYYIYQQRQTGADLDRPLLTGDGMTIMPTRLPADVTTILDRYKRVRLA